MMRTQQLMIALWSMVILGVVAWSGMRLGTAQAQIATANASRSAIEREVTQVQRLRAEVRGVSLGRRPDGDLITRIQRALSDAGIPVAACTGVQPRADQVRAGGGIRVQTVLMTLRGLTPAEFGAWLAAWRAGDQTWRLDDVQFTRAAASVVAAPAIAVGDSNRYDIAIVLAAPFVEE